MLAFIQANQIKEEAALVQQENQDLMEQVARDSEDAANLLAEGVRAQQVCIVYSSIIAPGER